MGFRPGTNFADGGTWQRRDWLSFCFASDIAFDARAGMMPSHAAARGIGAKMVLDAGFGGLGFMAGQRDIPGRQGITMADGAPPTQTRDAAATAIRHDVPFSRRTPEYGCCTSRDFAWPTCSAYFAEMRCRAGRCTHESFPHHYASIAYAA